MSRVKINFFDVLDKYEYWKRKCVKSVLGEFSYGVSWFFLGVLGTRFGSLESEKIIIGSLKSEKSVPYRSKPGSYHFP